MHKVNEEKVQFWNTEEGAKFFIEGSDEVKYPANKFNNVINGYFLRHCPPKSRILDVGCGHGQLSLFLARHGCSVVSCDASEPLLRELNKNKGSLPVETRHGNAYSLPAQDGEFDIVAARMFLMHFPDWQKIVKEMVRCCKPGGTVIYQFQNKENDDIGKECGGKECDFGVHPDPLGDPGKFSGHGSMSDLEKLCQELGLEFVTAYPTGFFGNRIIGYSLGTDEFNQYHKQLAEFYRKPDVVEFVTWFEEQCVSKLPMFMTYSNVIVLKKR